MPDDLTARARELLERCEGMTPGPLYFGEGDRTHGEEETFLVLCRDAAREVSLVHVEVGSNDELEDPERLAEAVALARAIAALPELVALVGELVGRLEVLTAPHALEIAAVRAALAEQEDPA